MVAGRVILRNEETKDLVVLHYVEVLKMTSRVNRFRNKFVVMIKVKEHNLDWQGRMVYPVKWACDRSIKKTGEG